MKDLERFEFVIQLGCFISGEFFPLSLKVDTTQDRVFRGFGREGCCLAPLFLLHAEESVHGGFSKFLVVHALGYFDEYRTGPVGTLVGNACFRMLMGCGHNDSSILGDISVKIVKSQSAFSMIACYKTMKSNI